MSVELQVANVLRARKRAARRLKNLIDPPHQAKVAAKQLDDMRVSITRDGVLTHVVNRGDHGKWRVQCIQHAGVSNWYPTPEKAAEAYGLVVHKWSHAA